MVAMNSIRVVQRHVNALLLSDFLCNVIGETDKEKTSLDSQWFFGEDSEQSKCERFKVWLGRPVLDIDAALERLVKGTALHGARSNQLRDKTINAITFLQGRWLSVYRDLLTKERESQPQTPYRKRIELEKKRHCGEYLLRDLAARTFLPGYGFPTDVVTFDNFTMEDYIREKYQKSRDKKDREDNVSRYKGLPRETWVLPSVNMRLVQKLSLMAVSSAQPVSRCIGTILTLIPTKPSVWIVPGAVINVGLSAMKKG